LPTRAAANEAAAGLSWGTREREETGTGMRADEGFSMAAEEPAKPDNE